jgi:DNA-binding SARP family transcriptional activator
MERDQYTRPGAGHPCPGGTPAPCLRIQTFGELRVWVPGSTVPLGERQWGSRIGKRLFAFLLTVDHHQRIGVERHVLDDGFWPSHPPGGSLHVILHRLRTALGDPGIIVYRAGRYGINWDLPGLTVDLLEFRAQIRAGVDAEQRGDAAGAWRHFASATEAYQGQYLEDFSEPWARQARREASDAHQGVLQRMTELAAGGARFVRSPFRNVSADDRLEEKP